MKLAEFLALEQCPPSVSPALGALWYDKQRNWNKAHRIVQNANDTDSTWVHAYLHRREGDTSNANYSIDSLLIVKRLTLFTVIILNQMNNRGSHRDKNNSTNNGK
jgi:hypothetical protein